MECITYCRTSCMCVCVLCTEKMVQSILANGPRPSETVRTFCTHRRTGDEYEWKHRTDAMDDLSCCVKWKNISCSGPTMSSRRVSHARTRPSFIHCIHLNVMCIFFTNYRIGAIALHWPYLFFSQTVHIYSAH